MIIECGPGSWTPGIKLIIPPPMLANEVTSLPSIVILIVVVSKSGILKNDTAINSSPGFIVDPVSYTHLRAHET